MKNILFDTNESWSLTVLRVLLGGVVLAHGAQKLLGVFGGFGFSGTMNFFTQTMALPWIIGFLVIVLEFFGAIALIAGLGTRIIAVSYTAIAIGIVYTTHLSNGFFMNWFGNQPGEGLEYFIILLGLALTLIVTGGGKASADAALVPERNK